MSIAPSGAKVGSPNTRGLTYDPGSPEGLVHQADLSGMVYTGRRPPMLRMSDLRIAYPGGTGDVLAVRSLEFAVGSFTCILGRSGCGKSSLLSCIVGIMDPVGGVLEWGGNGPGVPRVGMVFQEAGLFPWMTAIDNVMVGLRRADVRREEKVKMSREALASVGLSGRERAYPYQLSGGMKQRVVIARYLALHCDLLLLDEPFSGLDQFVREEMQDLLLQLYLDRGITCIFVTHSIVEAVYLGTRIVVLGGSPADVIDHVEIDTPYPRTPESRVSAEGALLRERLYNDLRPNAGASVADVSTQAEFG
ncbi:MAG: ABC transporter ATP-binding protein [Acidimicrobiales bacterium]